VTICVIVAVTADGQYVENDVPGMSNNKHSIPPMSQTQSNQSSVQNGQAVGNQESMDLLLHCFKRNNKKAIRPFCTGG